VTGFGPVGGRVTGGWLGPFAIPGWFGAENQGGGVAVAWASGARSRVDLSRGHRCTGKKTPGGGDSV
jgi:hypothetical protein